MIEPIESEYFTSRQGNNKSTINYLANHFALMTVKKPELFFSKNH